MSSAVLIRDPEDRAIFGASLEDCKEKMLDKTLADSFPASDPPSSIPDPCADSFAAAWPQGESRRAP